MMNKQLAFVKSGLGLALCFLMVGAGVTGSPDKPGGLSIQLCKSEKKEFYIRYSS